LQLSLFDNNPYAAGEEREYAVTKKGFFDNFHVGIVTTNKKRHRKSDKIRALLSYISRHVQVLSCSFCLTIYFIVHNILSCVSISLTCFASVLGYIQCSMATFPATFRMLLCIFAGLCRCFLVAINFLKSFSSGASLVVHKHSGGLAKAIATQVERYEIVQRCKLNSDGCLLWQNLTLLER
jgi:hypothetical protein